MVAPTGVEPVRPYERAILSRLRLPIPPRGHVRDAGVFELVRRYNNG